MKRTGLLALALCAALLWGATATAEEAVSAPVEAAVEALEVAIGAPEADPGEPGEEPAVEAEPVEAAPVEAAPQAYVDEALEDTGLFVEYDDGAGDGARAVSAAQPLSGSIGKSVWWTLSEDGTLTIGGEGPLTGSPWRSQQDVAVCQVIVCEGITGLVSNAFNESPALKTARLPSTLRGVGGSCFYHCECLEEVYMAGGTKIGSFAFWKCPALRTVELPEGLKSIERSAFLECGSLASIELPEGLQTIGNNAFRGTALTALKLPGSVETVGEYAFAETPIQTLEVGDGVKQIGRYAFYKSALTALKLPDSVETVGEYAFAEAPIQTLEIGAGVKQIGKRTFYKSALTALKLPDSVETVGEYAFAETPMQTLELGSGMKEIGENAFNKTALTALKLPDSVETVGLSAFSNAPIETLEIGAGVKRLGTFAFYNTALTALKLPDNVETVGDGAFSHSPIQTLEIGSGVTKIGSFAFEATAMTEVRVPATVQSVGAHAFSSDALRRLVFEGAPSIDQGVVFSDSAKEVWFLGGVPTFDEKAFERTFVAAMYPGGDAAWTEEARKAYGGMTTWVNIDASAVAEDARAKTEKLKAEKDGSNSASAMDNGDGTYTRVIPTDKGVAVEIYKSATDKLIWKKTLKKELPIWGGFYGGSQYNFLVFGQSNPEEDDDCEVVRVVRYTKNWNRVDAASVRGNNTFVPFDFGSLDMTQSGNMLYLHAAHLMYAGGDGLHHQANFDIDVYVPSMQATAVTGEVSYYSTGYVSHSFDQYIIEDGDDILQLDLGDAYPRAVALYRRRNASGSAVKSRIPGTSLNVLNIAGETGNNYTGVALAGLQATRTRYVVAGVSVSQSGESPTGPQNVFVAAVDKDNFTGDGVTLTWLTQYGAKDEKSLSGPRLVKLGEDSLMLLWVEDGGKTRYVFLDGSGQAATPIYAMAGMLTGGRPMVSGGQVSWVYRDGSALRLASLSADDALHAPEIKSLGNVAKGIEIKWDKVDAAAGYRVYRRTAGKKWKKLATVKGKTGYVDKGVKDGKKYYYMVRAFNGDDVSGYNDAGRPVPRLSAPKGVKASVQWGMVTVKWKKVTGASGYEVYRKAGGGKWKRVRTIADARRTSFTDWDTKSGKKYRYRVQACGGGSTSAYSATTKAVKP